MDWINTLRNFGARRDDVVLMDNSDNPSILPYLDLTERSSKRAALLPEAVVQVQRQPLLYLYSEAQFTGVPQYDERVLQIRRLMAMRGDVALIGILRHGVLELHSTALEPKQEHQPYKIEKHDADAAWLVPRLAQGNSPVPFAEKFIEAELFRLLDTTAQHLRNAGLPVADIVSLTGRAMFLRFLLDRDILPRDRVAPFLIQENRSPEEAFTNPQNAAATCRWLDITFNGDLLPLTGNDPDAYFNRLAQGQKCDQVLNALQAILHFDDPLGVGFYQRRLDWGDLHLAHVPVGLLSQVYERHMELFYPRLRKTTSAYYTPRHLAELMVDEAFFGLDQPHRAKILDPAAGAGVFLVASFHKLVEARWRQDNKRPDRAALREILNKQIRGFDVNCHALKLAALSLYLTRLELDPDPSPIDALRFESLRGKVLFNWSGQAETEYEPPMHPVIGSLGDQVGAEHDGAYDIVIGNPPWSAHDKEHNNLKGLYTAVSRQVAKARGVPDAEKYVNPDGVPDLSFLWRSMQWAKPGARIALALHGRWLFKQSPQGKKSRGMILKALQITGILNGAALRNTEVWPRVTAPFCLVFAENRIPSSNAGFFFVSPQLDPVLNKEGRLRIDAQAAEPVLNRDAIEKPWLLKSLFRGNRMSSEVVDKIGTQKLPTIEQYWKKNRLAFGEGYKTAEPRTQDADFLYGRLDVTAGYAAHPFLVVPEALGPFVSNRVHRRRAREIYQQPLVIIREGFRYDRNRGRALLVKNINEIAYSRSFFGLSCYGYPQAELLANYLLLLFHSRLALFLMLSTSSQLGVERNASLSEDLRRIPMIPPEGISEKQREEINILSTRMLQMPAAIEWQAIDNLIEDIYGMSHWERQVIADTLYAYRPNDTSESYAAEPSDNAMKEKFIKNVFASLEPFFSVTGRSVRVSFYDGGDTGPWKFINIDATERMQQAPNELSPNILEKADDLMVSRIIQTWENRPGCLRVGILDQARYWTPTQAKLLAADLLRNYGHQLEQGS